MKTISYILAKKIKDSRGEDTIEVSINGDTGSAPSGASRGSMEAHVEHADNSVDFVNKDLQVLVGKKLNQKKIDILMKEMDGTENYLNIGGNTSVAVSFAVYNSLFRQPKKAVFPFPLGNCFGGGAHKGGTDIQEILLLPKNARSVPEAIELNESIYCVLEEKLREKFGKIARNDEGALTAPIPDIKALDIVSKIAESYDVRIGLDVAASELWDAKTKKYVYRNMEKTLDTGEQIDFMKEMAGAYKLLYLEDPLHERDFEGFAELKRKIKRKCYVTGDDLTVTSPVRLKHAIEQNAINGIIIKPNQVGTVSEAYETVKLARKNKILPVISHRSGETDDVTISRLAVDWKIPVAKIGIMGNRKPKLDELLRLWQDCEEKKMNKV